VLATGRKATVRACRLARLVKVIRAGRILLKAEAP